MIPFIKLRWVWYSFSSALVILSLVAPFIVGMPYGIDFTGGTMLEIEYTNEVPPIETIHTALERNGLPAVNIQRAEKGYIIRFGEIDDAKHKAIIAELRAQIGQTSTDANVIVEPTTNTGVSIGSIDATTNNDTESADKNRVIERRFDTIGPVIGQELKTKSLQALVIVLFAIMAYIAWAFRKVSWPVKSWKYGAAALVGLFHNVIITFGAYLWAAHFLGWELDTIFVAALLTILGYSIHDTIVVFDRVRENLPRLNEPFDEVVNTSINQTLARSINTSMTTVLVLSAILVFGGDTLRPFVFSLLVGIIIGTYSSIMIASPLLVTWNNRTLRAKK